MPPRSLVRGRAGDGAGCNVEDPGAGDPADAGVVGVVAASVATPLAPTLAW